MKGHGENVRKIVSNWNLEKGHAYVYSIFLVFNLLFLRLFSRTYIQVFICWCHCLSCNWCHGVFINVNKIRLGKTLYKDICNSIIHASGSLFIYASFEPICFVFLYCGISYHACYSLLFLFRSDPLGCWPSFVSFVFF